MSLDHRRRPARFPPPWTPGGFRVPGALALLVAGLLCASPAQAQDDLVRLPVPDVVGETEDRARELVQRIASVSVRDTVLADVQAGQVVRQDPTAGTRVVVPGQVTLWVARAPLSSTDLFRGLNRAAVATDLTAAFQESRQGVSLPDLRGRHVREGLKVLQALGLEGAVEEVASGERTGIILGHRPEAGARVRPGSVVELAVASPQAAPTVPRVVGQPLESAVETLARVGLQVARVDTLEVDPQRFDRRPPADGAVVRQAPSPGSPLDPGATARLAVARWASDPDARVVTPDVVGRSLEEALGALGGAGLATGQVARAVSDEPARTVVEQKPPAGERVPPGTEVSLAISLGPRATIPSVVGLLLEEARARLLEAGFQPAEVSRAPSEEPEGVVLGQSPGPGVEAADDSSVDLTVAAAVPEPERVEVPGLEGLPVEEAEALLDSLGLDVGIAEPVADPAPSGQVVGQWPPAGTTVALGEALRLDVSSGPAPATEPVTVPQVVGLGSGDALDSLELAGLSQVEVRGEGSRVVDQFPSAGTAVAPGTPVLLTLQAQAVLPSWVRSWPVWGAPAGIALLWVLLRMRRVAAARRTGSEEPGDPDPEDDAGPDGRIEYRLGTHAPRGSVEVAGDLLPDFALSLRPRPPRSIRASMEVAGGGPLDPDAPTRSDPT